MNLTSSCNPISVAFLHREKWNTIPGRSWAPWLVRYTMNRLSTTANTGRNETNPIPSPNRTYESRINTRLREQKRNDRPRCQARWHIFQRKLLCSSCTRSAEDASGYAGKIEDQGTYDHVRICVEEVMCWTRSQNLGSIYVHTTIVGPVYLVQYG